MSYYSERKKPSIYDDRPNELDLKIWALKDRNYYEKEVASELGIELNRVRYAMAIRKRLKLRKKLEARENEIGGQVRGGETTSQSFLQTQRE